MLNFSPIEVRVLGCLIEKQLATPDYYPMTENSLVLASNQKSSRDPVLSLDVEEVQEGLAELSRKEFIEQVKTSGSRAFKYRQRLDLRWKISDVGAQTQRDQLAVLAVLALRGGQTVGQIRQRTERMFHFPDLESVETVIEALKLETEERPSLVTEDHNVGGRETRYTHLLGEHPVSTASVQVSSMGAIKSPISSQVNELLERVQALEEKVKELEGGIALD